MVIAWSLISSSILVIFSLWRKAIDIVQFRGELTRIGGIVSQNTFSEIIGGPAHPAPPPPTGMMFSQRCFVSHPSGMVPLEYGGFQLEHFS